MIRQLVSRLRRAVSPHLRSIGHLFILPAALIPIWLLAIAGFSNLGLLPAGTFLVAIISIAFIRSRIRASLGNTLLAHIGSKLILYCYVMIVVSLLFLGVQIWIFFFLTQFSPTLNTIIAWYNTLQASEIARALETLTFKARILIIVAIACSLIFFPLLSPGTIRLSKLSSKAIDILGALTVAVLLFAFYGASSGGLNAVRIELRSTQDGLERSYRQAIDETSRQLVKAVINQALDDNLHPLQPPASPPRSGGPANSGDGPASPSPRPPSPNSSLWDAELVHQIERSDERKTDAAIRKTKSSLPQARPISARQPTVPPPSTSQARLEVYRQTIADGRVSTRDGGFPTESPQANQTHASREMISLALDAADFPEIVAPAVADLVKETVSGEMIRDILKVLSDDIFAETIRVVSIEIVDKYLNGSMYGASIKAEIKQYASTFLDSHVGQSFKAALAKIRGYGAALVDRIQSYRLSTNDAVIADVEHDMIAEAQARIEAITDVPRRVDRFGELSRRSRSEIGEIAKILAAVAPFENAAARTLARTPPVGTDAATRAEYLGMLIRQARRFGYTAEDIGVCVLYINDVPVSSFVSTKAQCEGARSK